MFLLLLPLWGCGPRHEGAYVRRIRFEGNEGLGLLSDKSDAVLRQVVSHPYGRSTPTPPDPDVLAEDARRLEIWLAHKGYFDARFLGWVEQRPPTGRVKAVDLVGYVELGPPSVVRELRIEGLDQLSVPIRNRVLGGVTVEQGDVFDHGLFQETLAALPRLLHDNAYAYATAEGDVQIQGREVTVRITVTPGPACRIGEIKVYGAKSVAEKRVREQLVFEEGDGYRAHELAESRSRLFALRVFSVVSITPELSDPPSSRVPIRVDVRESKTRAIKGGISAGRDPGRAWATASAGFTHYNLGHQAWTLSTVTSGGYALAYDILSLEGSAGPLLSQEVKVATPRIAGPVGMVHEGKVELGVELGYSFFDATYAPALSISAQRTSTLVLGYRARYYQYIDLSETGLPATVDTLELNRDGQYFLSMLEQRALYDGRNDLVRPTRGWYTELSLAEAGRPVGGDYRFIRSEVDLRTYRSLVVALGRVAPRLSTRLPDGVLRGSSVAARVGGGWILPYGNEEESRVPPAERLYLGGGNTVRGWQVDALGPPCRTCASTGEDFLPAGGLSSLYGNLELRKMGSQSLGGTLFTDVGRAWLGTPLLLAEPLQWTVGAGLRYLSPLGPLRLDLGIRLGDDPMFKDEPRFGLHFGLSELF